MNEIFCFIKFTEQQFADKLLKEGEVYFNLPSSFNKLKEKERGDDNEGAEWIDNSQIVNIKADHQTLGTFEFKPAPDSPSKIVQYNYYYLSFSIYAVTPDLFDENDTHKIDSRMSEFGDCAVIIEKPYIFLNSIIAELKSQKLRYEIKPANYRDISNGRVDLSPFDKKQEHQHHCEFRIIIENTDNDAKPIRIGSIEKYSRMVSSKTIIESTWTAKRNPSISGLNKLDEEKTDL
jgi:hypothetical protein